MYYLDDDKVIIKIDMHLKTSNVWISHSKCWMGFNWDENTIKEFIKQRSTMNEIDLLLHGVYYE